MNRPQQQGTHEAGGREQLRPITPRDALQWPGHWRPLGLDCGREHLRPIALRDALQWQGAAEAGDRSREPFRVLRSRQWPGHWRPITPGSDRP